MATTESSGIFGKAETDFSAALAGGDRLAADKSTFLKLLVAQLSNQDPLNPTEDKEFVTQLAQFTSLEQLQNINEGVGNLNTTMHQSQLLSATSFIGKQILADGSQITKVSDDKGEIYTTDLYYTLDEDVAKGQANIFDANGNLVRSITIAARNADSYPLQWDGKNSSGVVVPDGTYDIVLSFQDKNDKAVMPKTQFVGRVVGVENENGVYSLVLSGGRTVKFTDVVEIYQEATSTTSGTDTGTGTETGSGTGTGTETP